MSTINKGTAGNDYITGTQTGNDYLYGGAGNDTIKAWDPGPDSLSDVRHRMTDSGWDGFDREDGDDLLLGGGYSDRLEGGAGNDTLDGGPGSDQLIGGPGSEIFRFEVLYASTGAPTLSSTGNWLTFASNDPGHLYYGFKNDVIEDFMGSTTGASCSTRNSTRST